MNCTKCGYAIPKGQNHCVYCGTTVAKDTVQNSEQPAAKRGGAFAKQIRRTPSEGQAESVSAAEKPVDQKPAAQPSKMPFAQKTTVNTTPKQPESTQPAAKPAGSPFAQHPSGAAPAKQPVIAPYARRPMYSSFDPNSEDSPFVRKPQIQKSEEDQSPDQLSDCPPESPAVVQMSEENIDVQPVQSDIQHQDAGAPEDNTTSEAVSEGASKKRSGLPVAALTLVFVALVCCWFIVF